MADTEKLCKVCEGVGQFKDSYGGSWECRYCDGTGIRIPKEKAWWRK